MVACVLSDHHCTSEECTQGAEGAEEWEREGRARWSGRDEEPRGYLSDFDGVQEIPYDICA